MTRWAILFAVLAGGASATMTAAQGQAVQYQFTPPPPIMPLAPQPAAPYDFSGSTPLGLPGSGERPYAYAPPHTARSSHHATRYVPTRHGRVVAVPPGRPGFNTFSDRVLRCQQAGSQAGLGPSQQGNFTAQCVN
jgi:hypothetical protein